MGQANTGIFKLLKANLSAIVPDEAMQQRPRKRAEVQFPALFCPYSVYNFVIPAQAGIQSNQVRAPNP